VAKVHRALHRLYPDEARGIARAAGFGTAQYIRRNRIPAPARLLLRIMPGPIGARLLTKAISAHAWTFCGSGSLSVRIGETISFRIENNPLLAVSHAAYPQCDWHVAVFEELFTSLLGRTYKAVETQCCAQGAPACTFEVSAV
jgi:divinyl protochlorophyllide a 8-vinyl-reductase